MATVDRGVCNPEVDAMDIISTGSERIQKRALVEVFSIRVLGMALEHVRKIHGVILVKGPDTNHAIFKDRADEKCSHVNSDGYFILTGPECGVQVEDTVVMYPLLFDSIIRCNRSSGETLWQRSQGGTTDRFIKWGLDSKVGFMRVDFAVYSDGVEAKLEIDLCNLELNGLLEREKPVQVYGTVKASNNIVTHPQAKSVLFDHITSEECVSLGPLGPFGPGPLDNTEIRLPLTRSMTVVPRESVLTVDVSLFLRCAPQKDVCIVNGSALFETRPGCTSTLEQKTLLGECGTVRVKAVWSC